MIHCLLLSLPGLRASSKEVKHAFRCIEWSNLACKVSRVPNKDCGDAVKLRYAAVPPGSV